MKEKSFRKLKYVPGNPQNAGFCTIYPTAYGSLDHRPKFVRLASLGILHLLFQNSLLLLCWKPCSGSVFVVIDNTLMSIVCTRVTFHILIFSDISKLFEVRVVVFNSHFQQYFSFIGGGNWIKTQTFCKSLTNFIT
jgi:hypothetical protein